MDFDGTKERATEVELKGTEEFLSRIENVYHDAPKRILDRVFDAVGFHAVGDGCPLVYAIHEGSKYEGYTMLPVVTAFVEKYNLEDFVVVADSGMMSKANVSDLEGKGNKYIIEVWIRNMPDQGVDTVAGEGAGHGQGAGPWTSTGTRGFWWAIPEKGPGREE